MKAPIRIALSCAALVAGSTRARADHHGMAMGEGEGEGEGPGATITASVSLIAATFSPSQAAMMSYDGNYEGVLAGATWAVPGYSAGASWAYYRLDRNGAELHGIGDLVVHGQAALLDQGAVQAGAMLAVSTPTGDEVDGLGMGHAMVMPAAYGAARSGHVVVTASFGYSRALVSGAHVHGMAPLVEPMNMSELTWSAGADVAVGAGVRAGARASGGVPVESPAGVERVVGALRVAWGSGRVDTAVELQAGLAGDPFNIRGVVSTALRF